MDSKHLHLDHMERLVHQIEQSLGMTTDCTNRVTGEHVYALARSMYFSVPQSDDQDKLTDEQLDEIFQKQYLKCSKTNFVARMNAKLKLVARQRARERELRRKGGR